MKEDVLSTEDVPPSCSLFLFFQKQFLRPSLVKMDQLIVSSQNKVCIKKGAIFS